MSRCKLHKVTAFVMLLSILNWGFVSTLSAAVMGAGHLASANAPELMDKCDKKTSEVKHQQSNEKSGNNSPDDSAGSCCAMSCSSCLNGMASFATSDSMNVAFIPSHEIISFSIDTYKNLITDPHLRPPKIS